MVPSIGSMIQRSSAFSPLLRRLPPSRNQSRARLQQFLLQDLLGAAVGLGHEVAGAFTRYLELLDLAEVVDQAPRCLSGCGVHDIDKWRGQRHVGNDLRLAKGAAPARCVSYSLFRPPIRMIPCVGRGEGQRESAQADHKLVFGALDIDASSVFTTIRVPASICGGTMTRTSFSTMTACRTTTRLTLTTGSASSNLDRYMRW